MNIYKHYSFVLALSLVFTVAAGAADVPDQLKNLSGEWKGEWVMSGPGAEGKIVKKFAWTDVMTVGAVKKEKDRVFVSTVDRMNFGEGIPPREVIGIEAYYLNADGSLGDYFFENYGQVHRMRPLAKGVWAYTLPAGEKELAMLGFTNVISATHVMVKVETKEEGKECHRISRITTVNWKDAQGKAQWIQFVSLKGMHRKV